MNADTYHPPAAAPGGSAPAGACARTGQAVRLSGGLLLTVLCYDTMKNYWFPAGSLTDAERDNIYALADCGESGPEDRLVDWFVAWSGKDARETYEARAHVDGAVWVCLSLDA